LEEKKREIKGARKQTFKTVWDLRTGREESLSDMDLGNSVCHRRKGNHGGKNSALFGGSKNLGPKPEKEFGEGKRSAGLFGNAKKVQVRPQGRGGGGKKDKIDFIQIMHLERGDKKNRKKEGR